MDADIKPRPYGQPGPTTSVPASRKQPVIPAATNPRVAHRCGAHSLETTARSHGAHLPATPAGRSGAPHPGRTDAVGPRRAVALAATLLAAMLITAPAFAANRHPARTDALGPRQPTRAARHPAGTDAVGPGCHPGNPAVAHHPGGHKVHGRGAHDAPIPCGMQTGFAGGESAIAVTNSGAVLYAPAVQTFAGVQTQYFLGGNSGFARTTNEGASWSFVDPIGGTVPVPTQHADEPGYPAWDQIDDKFFMDRATNTLFWADPDVPSEVVLRTDDNGVTWSYSLLPVGFGGEWTQVTTAKPRLSHPSGYPTVVYACGEYSSVGRDVSQELEGDLCQKSLDGGTTWIFTGQGYFGGPMSVHPQCQGQAEHPNFSPWAAPDPRGRLYELLYCGGKAFVVRSDDEAATWNVAGRIPYSIPTTGPGTTGAAELRSDAKGNLYLAWATNGNPNPNGPYAPSDVVLSISRDGGKTWSPHQSILAPGVSGIRTHFGFDVGRPGDVAFSYLGHRNGRAGFDGYITETHNALSRKPLFWSGIVNNPSEAPLDSGTKGSSNGLGLDYVSVAIGPGGTPWASFWDACGEDVPPPPQGCPPDRNPRATTTFGFVDFAGRLAPPLPTPAVKHPRILFPGGCVASPALRLRLRHPAAVSSATIRVGGRRVRVVRGKALRHAITVRVPSAGTVRVEVTLALAGGGTRRASHTYRRCARGGDERNIRGIR